MGDWNAATVIIALVILAVFLWIVIHGIRKRKRGGGCSCGGIGGGAQMALAEAGIRLYAGCSGDADECVSQLLRGTLAYADSATCDHHHGEDHACGDHGCGGHGEGHCGHHGSC